MSIKPTYVLWLEACASEYLSVGYVAMSCKYLSSGRICYKGCDGKRIVCHKFAKHCSCRFGTNCKYAHIAEGARSSCASDQDLNFSIEHEKACKVLGLDPKCTFLTEKMVIAMYRLRALDVHPDKNNVDTSHHMMIALIKARDYLFKYIDKDASKHEDGSKDEDNFMYKDGTKNGSDSKDKDCSKNRGCKRKHADCERTLKISIRSSCFFYS